MGNEVYANGREVSCKAGMGKTVCAFPDVCFTPPENPATPPGVPIPYPNTGMDDDTTEGSKSVQISGQEVMLKNKSYFKRSTGDEAGCAAKKGILTSVNMGKVYFNAWSMDVKIEGENVVRHLDLTTHNHASQPGQTPPWPFLDGMASGDAGNPCNVEQREVETKCSPWQEGRGCPEGAIARVRRAEARRDAARTSSGAGSPAHEAAQTKVRSEYLGYTHELNRDDCRKALRCMMVPKSDVPGTAGCPKQTGEHAVQDSSFDRATYPGYSNSAAPTTFTEGPSHHLGEHGLVSRCRQQAIRTWQTNNTPPGGAAPTSIPLDTAADIGADCHCQQNPQCRKDCIKQQTLNGHRDMGINPNDPINPATSASALSDPDFEIMELSRQQVADDLSG
jgi:hypothetical protein